MVKHTKESLKKDLKDNSHLILFLGILAIIIMVFVGTTLESISMILVLSMIFNLAIAVNLITRFRLLELLINQKEQEK